MSEGTVLKNFGNTGGRVLMLVMTACGNFLRLLIQSFN